MKKNLFYYALALALMGGVSSCSDEDEVEIIPDLTVTIQGQEGVSEMAVGDTLQLTAHMTGADKVTYNWTLNGQSAGTDSVYKFIPTELAEYRIEATVSDGTRKATSSASIRVHGKYRDGIFVLNEGAAWQGDKGGSLTFISPKGYVTPTAFQAENNGAWLGGVPQDLFIKSNKLYVVTQNGGNEGGILTIMNAETLKLEQAFQAEDFEGISWPTHVVVSDEFIAFLRDNTGIWAFDPSTKQAKFIEGTQGARKNTMAIIKDKVFAANGKNVMVIDAKSQSVASTIEFDSNVSGVIPASDGNLWVSTSSSKISKVNATDYQIVQTNDLSSQEGISSALSASFAAAPSITAKGDTLYMSGLSTKIYRHIFSKGETKLMVDAKTMIENAGVVYNTVAVDPQTGLVYMNTIKGYSDVGINQITGFDFSGGEPQIKVAYNNYTRFPAGTFFTANFK